MCPSRWYENACAGVSHVKRIAAVSKTTAARLPAVTLRNRISVGETVSTTSTGSMTPLVDTPRGTPPKIVAKISADVSRIVKSPDTRERFAGLGADSEGTTHAEFSGYFRGDVAKWSKVVKAAKLSSE